MLESLDFSFFGPNGNMRPDQPRIHSLWLSLRVSARAHTERPKKLAVPNNQKNNPRDRARQKHMTLRTLIYNF
jgi:hypothetical protein